MSGAEGQIHALLAVRIGLDIQSLGPTVVRAAIERRLRACRLKALEAYAARLEAEPAELDELTEELVVPETWFFRDRRPFEVFAAFAREARSAHRREPFRVLSLPCATGDEPYSLAIALLDQGWASGSFRVVGVDLSRRSIERAQAAVYDERALRAVAPEVRASYFERRGNGFSPLATVRNAVQFVQGNLMDLRAPGGIDRFDAVFCRNVLIYLTPQARSAVFGTLDRLLEPGGLLVLGHAESLPASQVGYTPVSDAASFAYRRQSAAPPPVPPRLDLLTVPSSARRTAVPPTAPPKPRPPAARPPAARPSQPASLLDQARELANRNERDQAIAVCQKAIQAEGTSAAAYHLLGMIQQTAGRYAEAEASLGRAVYLDPNDDDALLALALLAKRRGDEAAFRRFNRQADRLRTNRGGA